MSETKDIKTFHQTIDFDSLMREARKHITALAGELWTDHNSSDPGITQLEVLAFCIADLSYRTSFDVKDVLQSYKGGKSLPIDLPTADVALPNHPVTIKDLRKALIDMPHPDDLATAPESRKLLIRNAFPIIHEKTNVDFYAVSKEGKESFLSYDTSYEQSYLLEAVRERERDLAKLEGGLLTADDDIVYRRAAVDMKATEAHAAPADKNVASHTSVNTTPSASTNTSSASTAALNPQTVEPHHELPGLGRVKKEYDYLDQIILNGLYSLQIEFEDDLQDPPLAPHLEDLNQNYFCQEITLPSGEKHEVTVLFPYWDDIKWDLRNIDLNVADISYLPRTKDGDEEYFIAVDKLNYDDYFYDYYAELNVTDANRGDFKINAFIKINDPIHSKVTVNGVEYGFEVNFLDWNELSNGVKRNYTNSGTLNYNLQPQVIDPATLEVRRVDVADEEIMYDIAADFTFDKLIENSDQTIRRKQRNAKLLTRITFDKGTVVLPDQHTFVMNALKQAFQSLMEKRITLETFIYEEMLENSAPIYQNYLQKLNAVFSHLYGGNNSIWSYLGTYRNLAEDFAHFSASRVQEVALFGTLRIAPDHNVNELLGEVYFRVDQFLNPIVNFNALSNMVEKGYTYQEIFNGPLLSHGFIEDADLDNLKRRSVVYTSDLVRIIMDVPGVEAIEGFNISSYIDNRLMGRNVINCLNLTNSDIYKPRFSDDKTNLIVELEGRVQKIDQDVLADIYLQKKLAEKRAQLSGTKLSLSIPTGTDREIESYYSIQHDFPEVYGIGDYGLPLDATDERKAHAKQLKGFLLPFEQLLANYLKQIAHLPELFSFSRDVDRTYHHQPLYMVPDVSPLFSGLRSNQDTWEVFRADMDNVYQLELAGLESKEEYRSRRNRLLSHLLGRFGESFEAYSTQMFNQHKHLLDDPVEGISAYKKARGEALDELIDHKISFAEDYTHVTSERFNGFNTTLRPKEIQLGYPWQNGNIGSYKLRLCRLLGISEVDNTYIFQAATDDEGELIDLEGMHIVEHILLRPRTEAAKLMQLNNRKSADGNGTFIYESDKDPYSCQITVVLPRYAGRFQQEDFRKFTERMIRMETPAHIVVNFKWMSGECGRNFEEKYAAWKSGIYALKPYLFQNLESLEEVMDAELMVKKPVDASTPANPDDISLIDTNVASILTLQDDLTEALTEVCTLRLKVYDDSNVRFNAVGGVIRFPEGSTDVFHFRVNQTQGALTIYRLNETTGQWDTMVEHKPVEKTYLSIEDLTASTDGMSTQFGGRGRYRIEYRLEGFESVTEYVEVVWGIVPVDIVIGDSLQGVMFNFDTETDGIYAVTNQNWAGLFYQFMPLTHPSGEDTGVAMIRKMDGSLSNTLLSFDKDGNRSFKSIFEEFGRGTFRITYELYGQTTFADLQIDINLVINVFLQGIVQLPDSGNSIRIPADQRLVDFTFDLPFGTVKVYDLDGVSVMPASGSSPKYGSGDLGSPFGTVDYYKKVEEIQIDRDNTTVYQDGHHYRFIYEWGDLSTEVILFFEPSPEPEVKPTIELLENEKVLAGESPFKLEVGMPDVQHHLRFHPKDAVVSIYVKQDDGTEVLLETFIVPEDEYIVELELGDMYRDFREAPFRCVIENDAGEDELTFCLVYDNPPEPPKVTILENGGEMEEDSPLLYPDKNEYMFRFNQEGGHLLVVASNGMVVLEITEVKGLELFFDPRDFYGQSGETYYDVYYENASGRDETSFTLAIDDNPPEPPKVTILENGGEMESDSPLLYPDRNEYMFRFNQEGGHLRVVASNGMVVLEITEVKGLELFFDPRDFYGQSGETYYDVYYENTSGRDETSFTLAIDDNPPNPPEVTILENGGEMEEDSPLLYPDRNEYMFRFNQEGGHLRVVASNGMVVLEITEVKGLELFFDPRDFYGQSGETYYDVYYENDSGRDETSFTIAIDDNSPNPPEVTILENGGEMESDSPLLDPDRNEYMLRFNEAGGHLQVVASNGVVVLEITEVEGLELFFDPRDFHAQSGETYYDVSYENASGRDETSFSVAIKQDPEVTNDTSVSVINELSGEEIVAEDGVYHLVYDYQQEKDAFRLDFSGAFGEFILRDEDGNEYGFAVGEEGLVFMGNGELPEALTSGDYTGTFHPEGGDVLEIQLNVININPEFEMISFLYEEPILTAIFAPVYGGCRSYIWRVNGAFVTNAKEPEIALNFEETEEVEVTLTMHLEDWEAESKQVFLRSNFEEDAP